MSVSTQQKRGRLEKILKGLGRAAVAFSGGVDSALLLAVAQGVLKENVTAVTLVSPLLSQAERDDALKLAQELGVAHVLLETNELDDAAFAAHPVDKCYLCKKARLAAMLDWAAKQGIAWLLDGSNLDDLQDYRPGMRALKERPEVRSPLLEAGLTKADIRQMSFELGLFTWDKPARACLASRLPVGETITHGKLRLAEEAEKILAGMLPRQSQFRVRLHEGGKLVRLEVDEGLSFFTPQRASEVCTAFQKLGIDRVALDLGGYRLSGLSNSKEAPK